LYDKGVIDSFCPPDEEVLKQTGQASPATIDKAKNLQEVMNLVQESDEEASVEVGKAPGDRVAEEQVQAEAQQEQTPVEIIEKEITNEAAATGMK